MNNNDTIINDNIIWINGDYDSINTSITWKVIDCPDYIFSHDDCITNFGYETCFMDEDNSHILRRTCFCNTRYMMMGDNCGTYTSFAYFIIVERFFFIGLFIFFFMYHMIDIKITRTGETETEMTTTTTTTTTSPKSSLLSSSASSSSSSSASSSSSSLLSSLLSFWCCGRRTITTTRIRCKMKNILSLSSTKKSFSWEKCRIVFALLVSIIVLIETFIFYSVLHFMKTELHLENVYAVIMTFLIASGYFDDILIIEYCRLTISLLLVEAKIRNKENKFLKMIHNYLLKYIPLLMPLVIIYVISDAMRQPNHSLGILKQSEMYLVYKWYTMIWIPLFLHKILASILCIYSSGRLNKILMVEYDNISRVYETRRSTIITTDMNNMKMNVSSSSNNNNNNNNNNNKYDSNNKEDVVLACLPIGFVQMILRMSSLLSYITINSFFCFFFLMVLILFVYPGIFLTIDGSPEMYRQRYLLYCICSFFIYLIKCSYIDAYFNMLLKYNDSNNNKTTTTMNNNNNNNNNNINNEIPKRFQIAERIIYFCCGRNNIKLSKHLFYELRNESNDKKGLIGLLNLNANRGEHY